MVCFILGLHLDSTEWPIHKRELKHWNIFLDDGWTVCKEVFLKCSIRARPCDSAHKPFRYRTSKQRRSSRDISSARPTNCSISVPYPGKKWQMLLGRNCKKHTWRDLSVIRTENASSKLVQKQNYTNAGSQAHQIEVSTPLLFTFVMYKSKFLVYKKQCDMWKALTYLYYWKFYDTLWLIYMFKKEETEFMCFLRRF